MLEKERKSGPVVVIDGGNSFTAPEAMPTAVGQHALEQRQLKAELIGAAYAEAGIDAMALGPQDWTLGSDWLMAMVRENKIPILAANLTCRGEKPFPGHVVIEREGRRIGIVGVTLGSVDGCEVSDVHAALEAEAALLGPVDIRIGLVPALDLKGVGQALEPGLPLDLVLDGRGRHSQGRPEALSGVYTVGSGTRGKSLGLVRLEWKEGATGWSPPIPVEDLRRRLTSAQDRKKMAQSRATAETDPARAQRWESQVKAYDSQIAQITKEIGESKGDKVNANVLNGEEIPLNREIADHPATHDLVEAAKDKMSAEAGDPRKHMPPQRAPGDSVYAGAENCRGCHPSEYQSWAATPHATALQALVDEKRQMDDQCFSCHVTGAKQAGGPASPAQVFGLRDVQCEACHGAARAHVNAPTDLAVRPVKEPGEKACVVCHDGEQDEGRFDYASYLPKVLHGGGHGSKDGHGH